MCSWCYAFGPVWAKLQNALPGDIEVRRWLGGLAPDNHEPMPDNMREHLQAVWRRIEERVPTTRFNFDFWTRCQPRRSTYPSCRAVIAARAQGEPYDVAMTRAIQKAYYQEARNPSDDETLIALAADLNLDIARFEKCLNDPATQAQLEHEIEIAHELGANGFPSLVLQTENGIRPVPIDYNDHEPMLATLKTFGPSTVSWS